MLYTLLLTFFTGISLISIPTLQCSTSETETIAQETKIKEMKKAEKKAQKLLAIEKFATAFNTLNNNINVLMGLTLTSIIFNVLCLGFLGSKIANMSAILTIDFITLDEKLKYLQKILFSFYSSNY